MPRFFFHVCDGEEFVDLQGIALTEIKAARREAVRFAGALLADRPDQFWDAGGWVMRVADDQDLTLFQLTFFTSDAAAVMQHPLAQETHRE